MAYLVRITARAEHDLASLYEEINARDSQQSRKCYLGLRTAISGLREMPNRNPVTPENKRLRQLLSGRKPNVYRVIFRVRQRKCVVEILHIRHGARSRFTRSDLE